MQLGLTFKFRSCLAVLSDTPHARLAALADPTAAPADQLPRLRKLLEARTKLADLRNKMAGNDKLEDLLNDVLNSTEKLAELGQQANVKKED